MGNLLRILTDYPRLRGPWTLVLLGFVSLAVVGGEHAAAAWEEAYTGVFVGAGRSENRIIDPEGFAHWGRRGWATDYDDGDLVGGLLAGRKFTLNGARFRIELDGTFGDMSARSDRVDPIGRDETARAWLRWVTTARVGLEHEEGPVTVFCERWGGGGEDHELRDRHRLLAGHAATVGPGRLVSRQVDQARLGPRPRRRSALADGWSVAAGRLLSGFRSRHAPRQPLRKQPVRARRPSAGLFLPGREPPGVVAPRGHPPVRPVALR